MNYFISIYLYTSLHSLHIPYISLCRNIVMFWPMLAMPWFQICVGRIFGFQEDIRRRIVGTGYMIQSPPSLDPPYCCMLPFLFDVTDSVVIPSKIRQYRLSPEKQLSAEPRCNTIRRRSQPSTHFHFPVSEYRVVLNDVFSSGPFSSVL